MKSDPVNHPAHYTSHPSKHEAIFFSGQMSFCLGNAFKYLFRCGVKGPALEDLRKAEWYLKYELEKRWRLIIVCEPLFYTAGRSGPRELFDVLRHENRYHGAMSDALASIWEAHAFPRSVKTIKNALEAVNDMLVIEFRRS
jgi:hypothetical protein